MVDSKDVSIGTIMEASIDFEKRNSLKFLMLEVLRQANFFFFSLKNKPRWSTFSLK